MWHGEGVYTEFLNFKGCAAMEETPLGVDGFFAEAVGSEGVCKNGDAVFGAENLEPPGVVAMLVCEQDAGEVIRWRIEGEKLGF